MPAQKKGSLQNRIGKDADSREPMDYTALLEMRTLRKNNSRKLRGTRWDISQKEETKWFSLNADALTVLIQSIGGEQVHVSK